MGTDGISGPAINDDGFAVLERACGAPISDKKRAELQQAAFWYRTGIAARTNAVAAGDVRKEFKAIEVGQERRPHVKMSEPERMAWRAIEMRIEDRRAMRGIMLTAKQAAKQLWAETAPAPTPLDSTPMERWPRIINRRGARPRRSEERAYIAVLERVFSDVTGKSGISTQPESGEKYGPLIDFIRTAIRLAPEAMQDKSAGAITNYAIADIVGEVRKARNSANS